MQATEAVPYRLKVRIGRNQFVAEGTVEQVNEWYAQFLAASESHADRESNDAAQHALRGRKAEVSDDTATEDDGDIEAAWNRVYWRNGEKLSLHVLPTTKTQNADAIVLLLFGFQVLLERDSVRATELMESAKQSGLRIDRILKRMPVSHKAFINRGGNGKGTRYSLNNRGRAHAQGMLDRMFD